MDKIDFSIMGLDEYADDFLNWCMQNRNNLEFIKHCHSFEKISQSLVVHIDQDSIIQRIDDVVIHKRKGLVFE